MGTNKVATVVLLDVGNPGTEPTDGGRCFFERSKSCLERIVLRKIFSRENDELGIVLLGTEDSENRLYDGKNYSNITEFSRLQIPNFNLLDKIDNLKPTSVEICDWVEGIILALDFLKEEIRGKRFRDKQLVVLSNLNSELNYSNDKLSPMVNVIEGEDVKLIFIGVDMKEECSEKIENSQLTGSKELMFSFVNKLTCGVWLSFADAEEDFKYYEKKRKMKRLTKTDLKIGEEIVIPMKWMKLTAEETRIAWSKPLKNIPQTSSSSVLKSETDNLVIKYEMDVQKKVKFGFTEIILSYADLDAMKLKSGPASFIYLGSVKKSRITRAMITGEEIYVVVPDGTAKSHALVSALVSGLLKENKFGLARRIMTTNGKIYIGLLIPVSDELGKAFYFVKLPYSDCIKSIPYKPLPEETDPELSDLLDSYIDTMTLDSEQEILFRDPNFQNRCHIIYSRFKDEFPEGSTPKLPEHIRELFHPCAELKVEAEPILNKLNDKYFIRFSKLELNKQNDNQKEENDENIKKETTKGEDIKNTNVKKELTSEQVNEIGEIVKNIEASELCDDLLYEYKLDTQTEQNTEDILKKF